MAFLDQIGRIWCLPFFRHFILMLWVCFKEFLFSILQAESKFLSVKKIQKYTIRQRERVLHKTGINMHIVYKCDSRPTLFLLLWALRSATGNCCVLLRNLHLTTESVLLPVHPSPPSWKASIFYWAGTWCELAKLWPSVPWWRPGSHSMPKTVPHL